MTTVWFTADTHFGHRKVAEIRGFSDTAEHDGTIIANWNSVVQPDDTVWLLGDVAMKFDDNARCCVDALNGKIHLVSGNHDEVWPGHRHAYKRQRDYLDYFESVQSFARVRISGRDVLLSHFPYAGDHTDGDRYAQYRLRDEGGFLLHGHTHSNLSFDPSNLRQIHVGLDAYSMQPVNIDVLAGWL